MVSIKGKMITVICSSVIAIAVLTIGVSDGRASDLKPGDGVKADAYKSAIEKTGFFDGIVDQRISLIEEGTYKKLKYFVADDVKITFHDEIIEVERLVKHSIVKVIIVNGAVVEIVLIQEAS